MARSTIWAFLPLCSRIWSWRLMYLFWHFEDPISMCGMLAWEPWCFRNGQVRLHLSWQLGNFDFLNTNLAIRCLERIEWKHWTIEFIVSKIVKCKVFLNFTFYSAHLFTKNICDLWKSEAYLLKFLQYPVLILRYNKQT